MTISNPFATLTLMKKSGFLFLGLVFLPTFAFAAVGDIVIQEILFNPAGTDTGLEYIILKNRSSGNLDLTNWNLYSDSAGYFIFPNFSLVSQGEVKIHLRKSGANDANNLYYESASVNMGNSSGSIAIFSGTTRNKDTIQAFVRYQIPGKIESKTWEPAASGAGLWQTGDFVNIESLIEGQVIFLSNPDNFKSSQGWSIKTSESSGSESSSSQQSESSPDSNSGFSYVPPENLPKIKAYAGEDKTVIVGANAEFRGQAFGLEDEPLDNARYLWTFGDGTSKEGQNITHFYQYPGEYVVVLNVSSGEYSASDYLLAKAVPNKLFISEIKTGVNDPADNGASWLELFNNSKEQLDIFGWQLKSGSKIFIFPKSTLVRPNAYLVIPASVSGLVFPDGKNSVELLYAGGFKADEFNYDGLLKEGQSFNRSKDMSLIAQESPGAVNLIPAQKVETSKILTTNSSPSKNENTVASKNSEGPNAQSVNAEDKSIKTEESKQLTASAADSGSNWKFYLLAVLGLIVFSSAGVLFVRRRGGAEHF